MNSRNLKTENFSIIFESNKLNIKLQSEDKNTKKIIEHKFLIYDTKNCNMYYLL